MEKISLCHSIIVLVKMKFVFFQEKKYDYKQINLVLYQQFIDKLLYKSYSISFNIVFIINLPIGYNIDL